MGLLKFIFSKAFLIQIGLAIVVFGVILFAFSRWMASTTNHDVFTEVPNLEGKKLDITKSLLEERGLVLGDIEYKDYNPKFPKEAIVEQNPIAGAKVKSGRKIYVSVNKSEYRLVRIPNLNDKTQRQAESTLKAIGFKIGNITYKPHFAKDAVMGLLHKGKTINENDKLPYTSVIDLVLGDGELNYGEKGATTTEGTSQVAQ
ncbi:MAG: PASTA domain-containing protein [Flavobacteriaceae bacterium]